MLAHLPHMTANARHAILTLVSRRPLLALILFGLNALLVRELFGIEYLHYRDTIGGAYVGLARWMVEHPFEWDWFPLWYGGIPFRNAYPPVLHMMVAGWAGLTGMSPAIAHNIVTAFFYCLGPVTVFWFADTLSGRRWTSFAAAVTYSLVSASAMVIPEIASDMGTALGARRFDVLTRWAEGPHIASVALIPGALVAFHWAMRKRRPLPVLFAALSLAAIVLTNWLGALALAAAVASYLLAMIDRDWPRTVAWAAGVGICAYFIASPWIPPSTIAAVRHNSQHVVGNYPLTAIHLVYAIALMAGLAGVWWVMRRRGVSSFAQFCALYLVLMAAPTAVWYWWRIYLVPQPERYQIELEIPLVLSAVFLAACLLRRIDSRALAVVTAAGLLAAGFLFRETRRFVSVRAQPAAIEESFQYRVARWCDENLPGQRMYVEGSLRYWWNAFSDNPLLGGGFDQGISNPRIPHVKFGVSFAEGDGERAAKWLRAYGVRAVVVSGPDSEEQLRNFQDPRKFDGVLPELWRERGDAVYEVPAGQTSLARIIPREAVVESLLDPYLTISPLEAQDLALRDTSLSRAEFTWLNSSRASIRAEIPPNHLLSVAVTYDPGWHASVEGGQIEIRKDGLGLMILDPRRAGRCEIKLSYDGGREMRVAKVLSTSTLFAIAAWFVSDLRRRRSLSVPDEGA